MPCLGHTRMPRVSIPDRRGGLERSQRHLMQ
ncbi:hypothetical protein JMJ77_0014358, partial [Colletotrichum scovillei]